MDDDPFEPYEATERLRIVAIDSLITCERRLNTNHEALTEINQQISDNIINVKAYYARAKKYLDLKEILNADNDFIKIIWCLWAVKCKRCFSRRM